MLKTDSNNIRLTEHAHGAGCGCKIAPQVLQEILGNKISQPENKNLIVGNSSNDDAAVYDIGNGQCLIATTDFFMPIVDDAFEFGKIAAANAISDVYAMGGKPSLALAILGWPVSKLPSSLAKKVIEGATAKCNEAGIPLAGGHSIDTLEPMFGLSVNGFVPIKNLKKNCSAQEGDVLFLTKAIGSGIYATAQKRKLLSENDHALLIDQLQKLNSIGEKLGEISQVNAMTDVTGFGLLGHLIEMAEGSGLSAEINFSAVPKYENIDTYIKAGALPDATFRNWNAYQSKIKVDEAVNAADVFSVLPDPQTNGGLLISASASAFTGIEKLFNENDLAQFLKPIGKMIKKEEKVIYVRI